MVSKFEAVGIGLSVGVMALALYLLRVETTVLGMAEGTNQAASALSANDSVVVAGTNEQEIARALTSAANTDGTMEKLVINDVVVGSGDAAAEGSTVSVHYVGRLEDGQEFDNSTKRGEPFTFTIGEGRVIPGWEQGLMGMKVGGQRILVIPASLGYGSRAVGPIPPNSALIFSIELLEVK